MKLTAFMKRFGTDEACRAHLESVRWPHGPVCDRCGSVNDAALVSRRPGVYRCRACKKDFRVTVGTPIEDSRLPLRTWYLAMYLILASSKGISSIKLGEHLGVGQKTAWFLGHRIRAMLDSGDKTPLSGIVEADETYIGGKRRNVRKGTPPGVRGRGTSKPMLFAALERGGRARTAPIPSASNEAIDPLLFGWIDRNGVLATDELGVYRWFGGKMRHHITVNHARGEYARNQRGFRAHVNTTECFFGLFKRTIIGVFHVISGKHLHRYGAEHEFRWNHRESTVADRIARCLIGQHGRLQWEELVA